MFIYAQILIEIEVKQKRPIGLTIISVSALQIFSYL